MNEELSIEHYHGHRQRLKQRLIVAGPLGLSDYELLEMMLFYVIPRRDVKPLAKKLLEEFNSLANLINIDKAKLLDVSGAGENLYINLTIIVN